MIKIETKNCKRCNKSILRRKGQSVWHWKSQIWCSSNCRANGVRKGRPFKEKNVNWKGGRGITTQGYIAVYAYGHPSAISRNYVLEHRLVMERHLGRFLNRKEIVHHINHNKTDNRIENLKLISSQSEHKGEHKPNQETKNKISNSLKGRIFSEEHRKKLSLSAYSREMCKKIRNNIKR